MTVQVMFEMVQEVFPLMGFTEFLLRANRAYKQFCDRTRCLLSVIDMDVEADRVEYDIPSQMDTVKKIRLLDALGNPIAIQMKYTVDNRSITFTDRLGHILPVMPPLAVSIELWGVYVPDALSSVGEAPLFKEEFHDALVEQVMAEKLALAKDYQGATYHRSILKERERDAKIYAASEGDGSPINPDLGWF